MLGFAVPPPVLGAGVEGVAGAAGAVVEGAVVEGGVVLWVVVLSAPLPPLLLQAARPSSARAERDPTSSFFISSLLLPSTVSTRIAGGCRQNAKRAEEVS